MTLGYNNIIVDKHWWIKKYQLLNKLKVKNNLKVDIFKYIKYFSFFLDNKIRNKYLKFNKNVEKQSFLFEKIFVNVSLINKILFDAGFKEMKKRFKFNYKKLDYIFVYFHAYLIDLELVMDSTFKFLDTQFFFDNIQILDKVDLSLINQQTMSYLFINKLSDSKIYFTFFYNIVLYFLFNFFKKINYYFFELSRIKIILDRKYKLLNMTFLNFEKITNIYNYKYYSSKKGFIKYNYICYKNLINSNNNLSIFFNFFISNFNICKNCNLVKIMFFKINYYYKLLNYTKKNLKKFSFKFCNYCNYYIVIVEGKSIINYKNTKYFINDWLNLKKREGFFLLDKVLFYAKFIEKNKIIYKKVLLLNKC